MQYKCLYLCKVQLHNAMFLYKYVTLYNIICIEILLLPILQESFKKVALYSLHRNLSQKCCMILEAHTCSVLLVVAPG